jgi:hypothetical protein
VATLSTVVTAYAPVGRFDDLLRLIAHAGAPEPPYPIDVDGARLAQAIKHARKRKIGLLPASAGLRLAEPAIELARPLALLTESLVLVLDPERTTVPGETPGSGIEAVFAASLAPGVARLVPFAPAPTGAKVESIKFLLRFAEENEQAWGHVLTDLSGCSLPGELLGVLRLLDGIIVVGAAGISTERDLETTVARVPRELALGVLLVGG